MLSLINLQSTKNQSAKGGDPRQQPHSSENWCRPSGTRFVSTLLPGLTCRAFLCRRFAPGAMAQSAAPSKLSVTQLNQSPLRKFIHHPIVPSSLDQDSRPRSQGPIDGLLFFWRQPSHRGFLQIAQFERPDRHSHQTQDSNLQLFEQTPNLPVLAFVQRNLEPAVLIAVPKQACTLRAQVS